MRFRTESSGKTPTMLNVQTGERKIMPVIDFVKLICTNDDYTGVYIEGKPGCGKSELLKAFIRYLEENKKTFDVSAYTNKAAWAIGGRTIDSMLGKTRFDKVNLQPKNLQTFLKNQFHIVDEINMAPSGTLQLFAAQSQNTGKFICAGDPDQLGPIQPRSWLGNTRFMPGEFGRQIIGSSMLRVTLTENHRYDEALAKYVEFLDTYAAENDGSVPPYDILMKMGNIAESLEGSVTITQSNNTRVKVNEYFSRKRSVLPNAREVRVDSTNEYQQNFYIVPNIGQQVLCRKGKPQKFGTEPSSAMTNELFTITTIKPRTKRNNKTSVRLVSSDRQGFIFNYETRNLEGFGKKFNPADARTVPSIQGETIRGTVVIVDPHKMYL